MNIFPPSIQSAMQSASWIPLNDNFFAKCVSVLTDGVGIICSDLAASSHVVYLSNTMLLSQLKSALASVDLTAAEALRLVEDCVYGRQAKCSCVVDRSKKTGGISLVLSSALEITASSRMAALTVTLRIDCHSVLDVVDPTQKQTIAAEFLREAVILPLAYSNLVFHNIAEALTFDSPQTSGANGLNNVVQRVAQAVPLNAVPTMSPMSNVSAAVNQFRSRAAFAATKAPMLTSSPPADSLSPIARDSGKLKRKKSYIEEEEEATRRRHLQAQLREQEEREKAKKTSAPSAADREKKIKKAFRR